MRWRAGLLSLFALATPAPAQDAGQWLERMAQALTATDYQGTLVYVEGGHIETLRVFHSAREDRERIVALTGQPREVVRDGATVTCIGTAPAPLVFDNGSLSGLRPVADAARQGRLSDYAVRLGPRDERIAGRETVVVELLPRDGYRYGYRLWLDTGTGLPLRVSLHGGNGEALEQLAFTEIELGRAPAAADLRPSAAGQTTTIRAPQTRKDAAGAWRVADPPPGFTLRRHQVSAEGEHLVFSDGLASVSVYVEPLGSAPVREVSTRAGAVHARARRMEGHRVFVIGKVPAATIERFADGVTGSAPSRLSAPGG
ncbi:MucB/RseB C-terminal domain-containing protein [Rehaibacterium terrae]|jgi:sigma-E factor negative regulatory protein RseB|uniref:Sigma-E factor negative regulatory protein RseB n=1 Tax=Rehaibacterium terrae TaxID=1341696 RepID=A0A7W7Y0D0_9GAMM|nr:MucB/RseB C-terminal domain-containing protein [Rehaibacterium terrae]MBB5015779.1 sigma-E factor negative regulatory protein RseB [Rehaibacterium terrae]